MLPIGTTHRYNSCRTELYRIPIVTYRSELYTNIIVADRNFTPILSFSIQTVLIITRYNRNFTQKSSLQFELHTNIIIVHRNYTKIPLLLLVKQLIPCLSPLPLDMRISAESLINNHLKPIRGL